MHRLSNLTQFTLLVTTIVIACVIFMMQACNDNINIPDGAFDERIVDLSGSWTVSSVSLNGNDITDRMEFSRLNLTLEFDSEGPSTYNIENDGIPFIVTTSGNWEYDDKIYPTQMIFHDASESRTAGFVTPPISGDNSFSIHFILGCGDNIYAYQLTRQ